MTDSPTDSPEDDLVDGLFEDVGQGQHLMDVLEPEPDEDFGPTDAPEGPRPLQFRLSSLFWLTALCGVFCLVYLWQHRIGFLLFFTVTALYAYRRGREEKWAIPLLVFGGGAAVTGGLMMATSQHPAVALVGLALACIGGYAAIHGVGYAAALVWEGYFPPRASREKVS